MTQATFIQYSDHAAYLAARNQFTAQFENYNLYYNGTMDSTMTRRALILGSVIMLPDTWKETLGVML